MKKENLPKNDALSSIFFVFISKICTNPGYPGLYQKLRFFLFFSDDVKDFGLR